MVCERIDQVQTALGRPILVENISAYLRFADDAMAEWEFVAEVAAAHRLQAPVRRQQHLCQRGQSRLRSARFRRGNAGDAVAEIHLAGFDASGPCLIDNHGSRVAPAGVGTLPRDDRALRPEADADRVGHRPAPARRAARRGGAGATDSGGAAMPSLHETCSAGFRDSPCCSTTAPRIAALSVIAGRLDARDAHRGLSQQHSGQLSQGPRRDLSGGATARRRRHSSTRRRTSSCAGIRRRTATSIATAATIAVFLASYPPARELGYLPDVARLEWAIDQANIAADAAPFDLSALASVAPDALGEMRFQLHPSARLIASPYPVLRIWQVNQPERWRRRARRSRRRRRYAARHAHRPGRRHRTHRPRRARAVLTALAANAYAGRRCRPSRRRRPEFDLAAALRRHVANHALVAFRAPVATPFGGHR